jgi:hypothetical protein
MWSGRVAALRPLGPVLELGAGLLIAVFALQALRLGL